ncbi:MAG: hypothetical protein M1269_11525 [Chloroflexi bacterium]|nr:hypothetical protein [Chloroflexota bacterium]
MRKSLFIILAVGIIVAGICGIVYAADTINYQITPTTTLLWDMRMVTHFPDVAYVHVDPGVEKFGIQVETDAPGPICLEVTAPNNEVIYNLYDTSPAPHDLGQAFCAKKHGTGTYKIRVFQAHTAPLTYTLILTGPEGRLTSPCCGN